MFKKVLLFIFKGSSKNSSDHQLIPVRMENLEKVCSIVWGLKLMETHFLKQSVFDLGQTHAASSGWMLMVLA